MEVTQAEILAIIGQLEVERRALRARIAELEAELEAAKEEA